jgi:hypothetical protein
MMLKRILQKYSGMACTGFYWFGIGSRTNMKTVIKSLHKGQASVQ